MSSPTQGAWTCRHNVDGRDFCPECCSPTETALASETAVITWVVWYHLPGQAWLTWPAPAHEAGARAAYADATGNPRHKGLRYRLARRATVITDEIIIDQEEENSP